MSSASVRYFAPPLPLGPFYPYPPLERNFAFSDGINLWPILVQNVALFGQSACGCDCYAFSWLASFNGTTRPFMSTPNWSIVSFSRLRRTTFVEVLLHEMTFVATVSLAWGNETIVRSCSVIFCVNLDIAALDGEIDPELVPELVEGILNKWQTSGAQVVMPETMMPDITPETIAEGRELFLGKTAACVPMRACSGVMICWPRPFGRAFEHLSRLRIRRGRP